MKQMLVMVLLLACHYTWNVMHGTTNNMFCLLCYRCVVWTNNLQDWFGQKKWIQREPVDRCPSLVTAQPHTYMPMRSLYGIVRWTSLDDNSISWRKCPRAFINTGKHILWYVSSKNWKYLFCSLVECTVGVIVDYMWDNYWLDMVHVYDKLMCLCFIWEIFG